MKCFVYIQSSSIALNRFIRIVTKTIYQQHRITVERKNKWSVLRKVSRSKECKLYPGKGTTISQPTQKSFSYLQSTREIYVETDNDNQDISVDGHAIERMGEIKLLGVQIDEKLNFTSHISELCTKASQKVGVLVRLRNLIPCNAKLSLYKSSVLLHLTSVIQSGTFAMHRIGESSTGFRNER